MKELLLKKILQQYGFQLDEIEFTPGKVRIQIKDVNQQDLKREGEPIPGKADVFYHNYIYPEGLAANVQRLELTFYPQEDPRFSNRVKTIKIPAGLYRDFPAETANAMYETNHQVKQEDGYVIITVDYPQNKGLTPFNELMNQLIQRLLPRMPGSADILEGLNYISDMGRLAPLLVLGVQKEMRELLLRTAPSGFLLSLRDQLVPSAELVTQRTLEFDLQLFDSYLEKLVREEGYFAQLVRTYLKLDQKNWVLADLNLLKNLQSAHDANACKLKWALEQRQEPLFLSTTTGSHAFAIKIDFASQTLFLANPGEDMSHCTQILGQLKQLTGCNEVVQVINKQLVREGDIPFNDLCTVDSLVLAQMMMDEERLDAGCLNNASLATGVFIRQALGEEKPNLHSGKKRKPAVQRMDSSIVELSPLRVTTTESREPTLPSSDVDMRILGAFISVLGIAVVAAAFVALNMATCGGVAIAVATVGVAVGLVGLGIFAANDVKATVLEVSDLDYFIAPT